MDVYQIDAKSIKWAKEKNKALRRAILEIPAALTGLKKAEVALKKAKAGCKKEPEADMLGSFIEDIAKLATLLKEHCEDFQNDADAIQLGIIRFESEGRE